MTFLAAAAPDLVDISIANAGIVALLGYVVVFFGLILLMTVLTIMGKIFSVKKSIPAAKTDAPVAAAPVAAEVPTSQMPKDLAPGTAGQLKLYDTPPKTAAMIMAIVADKMGKPLNELRFISIKEVKE